MFRKANRWYGYLFKITFKVKESLQSSSGFLSLCDPEAHLVTLIQLRQADVRLKGSSENVDIKDAPPFGRPVIRKFDEIMQMYAVRK